MKLLGKLKGLLPFGMGGKGGKSGKSGDESEPDEDIDIGAAMADAEEAARDGAAEDGEGDAAGKKRGLASSTVRTIAVAGGASLALVLAAGGGWWWWSSHGTAPTKPLPRINAEIPAKDGPAKPGLLSPPSPASAPAPAEASTAEAAPSAPAPAKEPEAKLAAAPPAAPKPAAAAAEAEAKAPVQAPAPAAPPRPAAAPRPTVGETTLAGWVVPAAFGAVPQIAPGTALSVAPEPGLVESGDDGILPKIGADGREPRRAYARPFPATETRPKIAIIIIGLGLSRAATDAAIAKTPPAVTLAFDPHAKDLAEWVGPARQNGHETLIALPMEPHNFPIVDPGPYALWTTLDAANNIRRLEFVLSRSAGYVGVISQLGSTFTAQEEPLKPVMAALKKRGLMYVDGRTIGQTKGPKIAAETGVGRALVDIVLDADPSKAEIDQKLAQLEALAREKSVAVATGSAYPQTLSRLAQWAATLDQKRLVLAPISALADKQPVP